LTYHEAFVAQGAREILASGNWGYPTVGGLPWLEKPPLPWWLVAGLGQFAGVVNETVARFPSVLSATALVLGVAVLSARHYGPRIGLLAGAVQVTTAWTVMRGRLAEADVLLACLITWAIVAFDRVRADPVSTAATSPWGKTAQGRFARWTFFVLLGATALVKGVGFGAVLVVAVVAAVLLWQRDGAALRRLWFPAGWTLAAVLALAWPLSMLARHGPGVLALWMMHVADRLAGKQGPGPFAGEPWWEYTPSVLIQALPWTPLAFAGAWRSLGRALVPAGAGAGTGPDRLIRPDVPAVVVAGDRLLWSWTVVPFSLLALPAVKNAHYAIAAQVPWSIWAALALARLGEQLRCRGWSRKSLHLLAKGGFTALALAYGAGFWVLGPWLDRRGVEWAFYETAGRQFARDVPLVLLYDDWDRNPYESPFGAVPHDLAVRLFYLGRPACWHFGAEGLSAHLHTAATRGCSPANGELTSERRGCQRPALSPPVSSSPSAAYVIGRQRDLPVLDHLGRVEVVARGPSLRRDRSYLLVRIAPQPATLDSPMPIADARHLGALH
jgi:hypothetical protein